MYHQYPIDVHNIKRLLYRTASADCTTAVLFENKIQGAKMEIEVVQTFKVANHAILACGIKVEQKVMTPLKMNSFH